MVEGEGLSRRQLVRRAVGVGAAAWSAPVILSSISSPAAAATASGCYLHVVRLRRDGNSANAQFEVSIDLNCAATAPIPGPCQGSLVHLTSNGQAPVGSVTLSGSYSAAPTPKFSFTYTLPGGSSCYVVATAKTDGAGTGTTCESNPTFGLVGGAPATVTFDVPAVDTNNVVAWAYVIVSC